MNCLSLLACSGGEPPIYFILSGGGLLLMIASLIAVLIARPAGGRALCWISAAVGFGCFIAANALFASG